MQNADSSSLSSDDDAAVQTGSSAQHVAMLGRVADICPSRPLGGPLLTAAEAVQSRLLSGAGHEKPKTDSTKSTKPNARRLLRLWRVREVGEVGARSA